MRRGATALQARSAGRCSGGGCVGRAARGLLGRGGDGGRTAATGTLGRWAGGACATAAGLGAGMGGRRRRWRWD